MGVNIYIVDEAGHQHPEWVSLRTSGDRELAGMVIDGPRARLKQEDDDSLFQPLDLPGLVAQLTDKYPHNAARWRQLAEILADPRWWLYFSW